MHMADALISPAVGGTLWAATAGTMAYCCRKVKLEMDDRKVALMGVLGAFIFSAQMINFTIPATGSSGHLGGGMILAILLGPYAAFLVMASVLTVQALFFADGGLLALGCNIFNLAFFPCFIAYPFIYKKIVGKIPTEKRIFIASMLAAVVGLQLGALGVVIETVASGISELPFTTFLLLMQPIHLAIGIVEGLVTAAVVIFIWKARPDILRYSLEAKPLKGVMVRNVALGLLAVALVTGTALSWFASSRLDGLEWSIEGVTGSGELQEPDHGIHESLAAIQEKSAFLPDYGFKTNENEHGTAESESVTEAPAQWPAVDAGTSTAGLVGGLLTLLTAGCIGLLLRRKKTTV